MLLFIAQIILILLSPIAYLNIGRLFYSLISRIKILNSNLSQQPLSVLFFPGLAIHTYIVLAAKCAGAPWETIWAITLVALIFPIGGTKSHLKQLKETKLSLNFALWIFVILGIGLTILDTTNQFETYWVNAYGDQAYHLGMISSFTFGENFPPQNHILAGHPLSYPFFVNLWAASLWWPTGSPESLSLIFLFQWLCIWIPVFYLIKGDRYPILPWALLFGGGSLARLGIHAAENIKDNYPWVTFIPTIWIPQRAALMGLLGGLTALSSFNSYLKNNDNERALFFSGCIIALMPLVHTHLMMLIALYVGITIIFTHQKKSLRPLIIFGLPATLSLHSLPWIAGKENIFRFIIGWYSWSSSPDVIARLWGSIKMWTINAGHIIVLIIPLWLLSKKRAPILAITLLFILGNLIQLAVWDWDQIKVFMTLYLIFISLWSTCEESKGIIIGQALLLITLVVGVKEASMVFSENRKYAVYSADDWQKALAIRQQTEPNDIILSAPNHNSLITLTGRKLFMGFPGTLYSHGNQYLDREEIFSSLTQAVNCRNNPKFKNKKDLCPDHLLWAHNEIYKWNMIDAKSALQLEPTTLGYLYKIRD
jgi:hypothetical protein